MPSIRIRVGASIDADLTQVFRPLEEAAERARTRVRKSLQDATKASSSGASRSRGNDPEVAAERSKAAEIKRIQADRNRDHKAFLKDVAEADKAAAKEAKKAATEHAKAFGEAQKNMRQQESRLNRAGGSAVRTAGSAVRGAVGVAGDIARGAGVDFSIAGSVKKRVDQERIATEISNSAYMPGQGGRAGERQDPRRLMQMAQSVGAATATDPTKALEGIQAFVGKTGDLETAEAVFGDLARLAKATGTSLDDMVSAAGEVGNAFDALPAGAEKAKAIETVMRGIAGQGKAGAVEIKDLSTQMAKLVAAGGKFGGDTAQNLMMMGALAQEARGKGGASSANIAATSVAGFANTLSTPARIAKFKAQGIDVYDKDKNLADPRSLILQSLQKTKGNPEEMKKLFANVMGERAVTGFSNIYRKAGGGEAGTKAVNEEFDKLLKGTMMAPKEVADSFARSMGTAGSQAELFQQKLDRVIGDMADQVIPKLLELAPVVERAAQAFAGIAGFAAENPLSALAGVLAASVAKAGIEEVLRGGVTALMQKAASSFGAPGAIGLAVAALAITAQTVSLINEGKKSIDDTAGRVGKIQSEAQAAVSRAEITQSPEDIAAAQQAMGKLAELAKREAVIKEEKSGVGGTLESAFITGKGLLGLAGEGETKGDAAKTFLAANAEQTSQLNASLSSKLDALTAKMGGVLQVEVKNQPGPGPPPTPQGGRTPGF